MHREKRKTVERRRKRPPCRGRSRSRRPLAEERRSSCPSRINVTTPLENAERACRGKAVLVTGAAGFIGSHVCELALEGGARRVLGLDNFVSGLPRNLDPFRNDPRFDFTEGDVRDFNTIAPLVREADLVIHEAASKLVASRDNPRVDLETNILGTFNVLEAAREKAVPVVHVSTGSVLGNAPEGSMREDHPKRPSTLYGISKSAGEEYALFYAREFGVPARVIRYFHVFGPRQDYSGDAGVVSIFLARAMRGQTLFIHGSGEQIRCFTFVRDTVAATFLLAAREDTLGEVYNVASRNRVSVKELAGIVLERYGAAGASIEHDAPRPGENLRPIPLTEKIESLGWKAMVSFDEGLEATAEWVRATL
ncbi:MAG: NAD-dependent epimerase/dehydratase family protein [Candidatus Hydrogenedentota bacterium]|nr:MAG: NAD-dependent epimerase/dehydratase family protein [Candidatus Hydrogenedentota bacterium]